LALVTADRDRSRPSGGIVPPTAGLCASCRQARSIVSGRGSSFVLCQRSRTDARFPRYPPLPVRACVGHDPPASPG
ncbi:MAG TPA: hypothetical protein VK194_12155, partial [Candidatus Deferrimicrobium sp.]|nr:hypothetical protein [Candidatus Deferrimicrobium sp.]